MSRPIRLVHAASFGVADRGDHWMWVAQATWHHQMRGVKGRHKRIVYGQIAKAEHPKEPTLEAVIDMLNTDGPHQWDVTP